MRDGGFRVLAGASQLASSLALGVLTARLLGPEGKGQLYLVVQVGAMGGILLGLGLGPAYQYHKAKKLLDTSTLVSHAFAVLVASSLALIATFLWGRGLLAAVIGDTFPDQLIAFACLGVVLNQALLYFGNFLAAEPNGIRTSAILSIASAWTYVGLLVVLVALLGTGIPGAASAYQLALLVQIVPAMVIVTRQASYSRVGTMLSASKPLFAYGVTTLAGNLLVASVFRIDAFLVNAIAGDAALGNYSVSVALAEWVLFGANALGPVLFTHLPSMDSDGQDRVFTKTVHATLIISTGIGVCVAILARPVVAFLMGQRFGGAVDPVYWLLPGLIAMAVNTVIGNYYSAKGRPGIVAGCFALGLAVNVGANLLLIPKAGIVGAAMASTAAYVAILCTLIWIVNRHEKIAPFALLVPTPRDLREGYGVLAGVIRKRHG